MFKMVAKLITLFSTSLFIMSASAIADERLDASKTLVDEMAKAVKIAIEQDYDTDEDRIEAVNELLDTYFDFDGITRFSAGRYWKKATDEEKTEYKSLFRLVLTGLAARQFDQLKGLDYTVTDAVSKGKKLVLVTGVMKDPTGEQADAIVSWRVSTVPNKPPLIIDVEIENISMLITQQQENTSIIRKNGGKFSALNDVLRQTAEGL